MLGDAAPPEVLEMLAGPEAFDMTRLALDVSHYVNGVALRHREVSSTLFPGYDIHQITNAHLHGAIPYILVVVTLLIVFVLVL